MVLSKFQGNMTLIRVTWNNYLSLRKRIGIVTLGVGILIQCGADDGQREPLTPQDEYTLEAPGIWSGLEESHLPIIQLERKGRGLQKITITIKETKQFNLNHYIEKIGIMNENKEDIAVKIFPEMTLNSTELIMAEFQMESPVENNRIKAFVKCNLHDLWTHPLYPDPSL